MRLETSLPIGKVDPGLRDVSMRLDLRKAPTSPARSKRREDLPKRITDEGPDTIAVIRTYDEFAVKLRKRYGSVATGIEFGLPLRTPADREAPQRIIRGLHGWASPGGTDRLATRRPIDVYVLVVSSSLSARSSR